MMWSMKKSQMNKHLQPLRKPKAEIQAIHRILKSSLVQMFMWCGACSPLAPTIDTVVPTICIFYIFFLYLF